MRELKITHFFFLFFCCLYLLQQSVGQENDCKPSQCQMGGPIIEFPFRIKDQQPEHCGYPGFELTCKDGNTILQLPSVGELRVYHISYSIQTISVLKQCLAKFILGFDDINSNSSLSTSSSPFQYYCDETKNYTFFSCPTDVYYDREHIHEVPCLTNGSHTIVFMESYSDLGLLPASCNLTGAVAVPISSKGNSLGCTRGLYYYRRYPAYLQLETSNLELRWEVPGCNCSKVGESCRYKNETTQELECFIEHEDYPPDYYDFKQPDYYDFKQSGELAKSVAIGVSIAALLVFIAVTVVSIKVYKWWKLANEKTREDQLKVEKFLEDYKSLKPIRYSYSEIKKITKQFKCKLGQGGYGSVFKGELSNGILVAVKILKGPASDGDDFINEVGTIGRIHHVNVVRLLGYCADGYKRALIYEFMPNESLEKFIFSEDANNPLRQWEKLQDIAISIARGIEYLHQGCDQRILHFDIKPHNILLDKNLNPKISDFGLAKLCAKGESNVSMTVARGTMGYIAPEVFSCWNYGNVSYKSDVYSFGMLLFEMVGGRKNLDASVEHSSKVYFPEWIYNRVHQGQELGLRIVAEEDAKIARLLTIVAAWCIQWYPSGRPSMNTVIRMLEGEIVNLEMPPNPFVSTAPGEAEAAVMEGSQGPNLAVITE